MRVRRPNVKDQPFSRIRAHRAFTTAADFCNRLLGSHGLPRMYERPRFGNAYRRFLKAHVRRDVGVDEGYFVATRDREAGRTVAL